MPPTKNAFLHPNDPVAKFPRIPKQEFVDFRSTAIPEAAYACRGSKVKSKAKFEKIVLTTEEIAENEVNENEKKVKESKKIMDEKMMNADFNSVEDALNMMSIGKKSSGPQIINKGISKKKRMKRSHKATIY